MTMLTLLGFYTILLQHVIKISCFNAHKIVLSFIGKPKKYHIKAFKRLQKLNLPIKDSNIHRLIGIVKAFIRVLKGINKKIKKN